MQLLQVTFELDRKSEGLGGSRARRPPYTMCARVCVVLTVPARSMLGFPT